MSSMSRNGTKKRARIPTTPTTPARSARSARSGAPQGKQGKQHIDPAAFYDVADLRAITGAGTRTIYAILRPIQGTPRRKYRVTGAEFLALRAAYLGLDVAGAA